jgi:aminopeptidase N
VYEKGAEVVRMIQTLVGREGFRAGMDLYFQRHDGQAVTCDDFAQAMADANPGTTLAQHLDIFQRWYSQSGTPEVTATGAYNADAKTYALTLRQKCSPTPGQPEKQPFLIPVRMGLIDSHGQPVSLRLCEEDPGASTPLERVLVVTETEQTFTFSQVESKPVPSLLRQFSAPVWLAVNEDDEAELLHLLAHDADPFNRWEAAQKLMMHQALRALEQDELPASILDAPILSALRGVLGNPGLDPAFKTLMLSLPDEDEMAEALKGDVDPQRIKHLQPGHAPANGPCPAQRMGAGMEHTQIHRRLPARSAKRRQTRPGQSGTEQAVPRGA